MVDFYLQMKYFADDAVMKCLHYLHVIESKDLSLKCEVFTLLTQTIPLFPKVTISSFYCHKMAALNGLLM